MILCPQVQAQLLQFAAKNIGLNPALLTSPINPQHMTLLNQLYQLQLVSLISAFLAFSFIRHYQVVTKLIDTVTSFDSETMTSI